LIITRCCMFINNNVYCTSTGLNHLPIAIYIRLNSLTRVLIKIWLHIAIYQVMLSVDRFWRIGRI